MAPNRECRSNGEEEMAATFAGDTFMVVILQNVTSDPEKNRRNRYAVANPYVASSPEVIQWMLSAGAASSVNQ